MTDGIIQQVFIKYTFDPLYMISNRVRLDLLEQELIEKIKQEFKDDNENYVIQRLIGDNKE